MSDPRNGTLSDAIAEVTTIDILEAFDVPHKTKRGRTYILCPGHDDRHFGSCYVDKNDNGYYCYVCGRHVNKWNMVLTLNGNQPAAACNWFFATAGISPSETQQIDPYKIALKVIRQLDPHIRNNAIYNDTHACDKIDSSYGRNINGEYLYSELLLSNPLLELYKNDKNLFKKVTIRMLQAKINKIAKQKMLYGENKDESIFIEGVGLIPFPEMEDASQTEIDNIQELINTVKDM